MKSNRDIAREIEKVTTLETLLKRQADDIGRPPPPRSAPATDTSMNSSGSTVSRVSDSQSSLSSVRRSMGQLSTDGRTRQDSSDVLKEEINHLQHALVDKFKGNQKLVSGAQFRSVGRDSGKCEGCETRDSLLKKSKENIRSLKFQLRQLEDRLGASTTKKFSRSVSSEQFDINTHGLSSAAFDNMREENDSLRRTIIELEQGNSLLNSLMASERRQATEREDNLSRSLTSKDEVIVGLRTDLANARENEKKSVDQLAALKHQFQMKVDYANDLEGEVDRLKGEVSVLQLKCSEANSDAESAEKRRLGKELEGAREQIGSLQRELQDAARNTRVLNHKLDEALAAVAAMQCSEREHAEILTAARQELAGCKNLLSVTQEELAALHDTKSEWDEKYQLALSQIADLKMQIATQDPEIDKANERVAQIQSELDAATARLNSMVKRMTAESEKSAQAVQKAIQSSVRLCVVAPTVNVHVADKKMKFRSTVPKEKLNEFLEHEILGKYTFLFEQQADNVGPDGYTDIQPWIKRILGEMQTSIEDHISTAMKSSAG